MTTVVTGATGHVGANLIRALIAQGHSVRALVHVNRRALDGLAVELVEGNICNPDSLANAFRGADVVYHLAAHISIEKGEWPLLESVNVAGTRNVVEACLSSRVRRLVHFSSIHSIASSAADSALDESCTLVESGHCQTYDFSKATAEREVCRGIENGLNAVIISPTAIIGPYDFRPSHLGQALLRMANGKLPALVDGGFNWVDVRDIVHGAIQAEKLAPTGAKYLLSGHWASLHDLAKMVEQITGVPAPGFVCPTWLARLGAPFVSAFDRLNGRQPLYTGYSLETLHSHRNISHRKATDELGYQPRPLEETLADTLMWFGENGLLTQPLQETAKATETP